MCGLFHVMRECMCVCVLCGLLYTANTYIEKERYVNRQPRANDCDTSSLRSMRWKVIYPFRTVQDSKEHMGIHPKNALAGSPLFIYVCYIELVMPNFNMLYDNMAVQRIDRGMRCKKNVMSDVFFKIYKLKFKNKLQDINVVFLS